MPRLIALVATLGVLIGAPAVVAQETSGSGPNHVVNAANTEDATMRAHSGVQVASTGAKRVEATNLAIAGGNDCTGCESRAAAYQAVFITGEPSYVSPRNVAAATNANCIDCASFAFAYQYAVTTGGPVRLTDAGRDKVNAIREEADLDLRRDLPYDELQAELHELAQRFRAVIDSELRRAGTEIEDRESVEQRRLDTTG